MILKSYKALCRVGQHSAIAQSVERLPVKEDVPGSSPGRGASENKIPDCSGFLFCALYQTTRARNTGAISSKLARRRGGAQTEASDDEPRVEGETPGRGALTIRLNKATYLLTRVGLRTSGIIFLNDTSNIYNC